MTTAPTPISAILSLTLRAPNQAERRPKALIIGWSRDYLTFPYSTSLNPPALQEIWRNRAMKAILKDERDVFREIRARNGERRPAERVPAARAAGTIAAR